MVFSISSRRVEISVFFNGCENQSKKIHVLFAISKPLVEFGTIQKSKSPAKNISNVFVLNSNLPVNK